MYKGWIPIDLLISDGPANPSNDAIRYGVANWFFYNVDTVRARQMMEDLVNDKAFSSFGYVASESDLIRYFSKK